jgi:hypothetical protein
VLIHANGRLYVFYVVNVRLFKFLNELPSVGGKAVEISTLAFGIQDIFSDGGFP